MVYKASNPGIKAIIDYFRTGKYGEAGYTDKLYCSHCGAVISHGNDFYKVKEIPFCMDCAEVAEAFILDCYRDRFIYEF